MIWKILGSLLLIKYGLCISQFLWKLLRLYVLPNYGMNVNLKKYGNWAVITGSTDGIGKEIAKELARRRFNVVLISRSQEKLTAVAQELQTLNIEVRAIVYDFSITDNYEVIAKGLEGLDIGILVNNVGVSYQRPDFFLEFSDDFFQRMVDINIASINKMTKIVLEGMVKRKRGLIVHVSSAASKLPVPMLTVYSASKAFVTYLGSALQYEYASHGIKNQVVTPMFVATNMSGMRAKGSMVPSAECYAQAAVNAFGLSSLMAGWWAHEIFIFIQNLLPESFAIKHGFSVMKAGRERWLRKQALKQE